MFVMVLELLRSIWWAFFVLGVLYIFLGALMVWGPAHEVRRGVWVQSFGGSMVIVGMLLL